MRVSRTWRVVLAAGVVACGGKAVPEPRAREKLWCPPPVEWRQDQMWPLVMEVANTDSQTVAVYLDGCDWHQRATIVAAGTTVRAHLPKRVIAHSGMLRFHWFRPANPSSISTVEVPLDSALAGRLRIRLPADVSSGCNLAIRFDSIRTEKGEWMRYPIVDGDWRVCGASAGAESGR